MKLGEAEQNAIPRLCNVYHGGEGTEICLVFCSLTWGHWMPPTPAGRKWGGIPNSGKTVYGQVVPRCRGFSWDLETESPHAFQS